MIDRLNSISTKQRAWLALAAGALCSLGLPPLGWFPVLWLGFPLLLLLLQGTTRPRQAFWLGWCFAFGYFVLGLYWIAAALFVDFKRFFWLVPITVAGLPALLAVFYGLATLCWQKLRLQGVASALALALLFTIAEYGRGHLFSGFPWNLFGYVWADFLPIAQVNSLIGSYGLTLLTLVAACLPVTLFSKTKSALLANGLMTLLFISLGLWGAVRLQQPTLYQPTGFVRLVQPNTAQNMKWEAGEREKNFQTLLSLSAAPASQPLTHIIWPETAATFYLEEDTAHRAALAAALPQNTILLTGTLRRTPDYTSNHWNYYNSLLALDTQGEILTHYDKAHLVPFGEYVPLRGFAPIAAVTSGLGSFMAGEGAQTLHVTGLPPFSPLICYEVIFPHAVSNPDDLSHLLINITNDAWYGRTAGPHQHLAIARMRAIEEGVPLLRVANSGISAVVDVYGRVLQSLPLSTAGVLDTAIPQPDSSMTPYRHYGDLIVLLLCFLLVSCILLTSRPLKS